MKGFSIIKGNIIWIVLASAFFYMALILFSDVNKISEHFFHIRPELVFLIFFVGFSSHIIKSLRQKEFLKTAGEKIPFKPNLVIYLSGLSLISTPGGIGTLVKSKYLEKQFGIPNNKSISVILLERYHDLLATTTIVILTLFISFSLLSSTLAVISCLLLIGFYFMVTKLNVFSYVQRKLLTINFLADKLTHIDTNESFSVLTRPTPMLKGLLLSLGGWGLDALAVYIGFLAFNIDLGYLVISQIYFTSLGYGILSLIPGGIGVTEGIFDYMLVNKGLDLSIASSIVIFTRLTTIWFVTILGIVFTRYAIKQKPSRKK